MYETINEGKSKIKVPSEKRISKELPVFYNPVMKFNRDMTIFVLNAVDDKQMVVGLPLAGSGVRAVRMLKELPKSKIKELHVNDANKEAVNIIKQNLKMNDVSAEVHNKDANMFILETSGLDYIDIDPFGSPNFLLNNSIVRLSRGGILAITATDTGCLAGSFPKACRRKYWAKSARNDNMHETGLRILIRKVQMIGAEHDKALIPMISYFKDHYFRVFFRCEKGKSKVDMILDQHGMFREIGPMWLGKLWDKELVSKIKKMSDDKFIEILHKESKADILGFHNLHMLCKRNKISAKPFEYVLGEIREKGYIAEPTHFKDNSVKSDISEKELVKILKKK